VVWVDPPLRTGAYAVQARPYPLSRPPAARAAKQTARVSAVPSVKNVRDLPPGWQTDPQYVYIGRKNAAWGLPESKWMNPFVIGTDGDRATVLRLYEQYLNESPALQAALPELRGKTLVCWCAPLACHGDILLQRVAEPDGVIGVDSGVVYTEDTAVRAAIRARLETRAGLI
jgi:hypothetical protein